MKILVTDGNFKQSLGIVRSLGMDGYKPYILSSKKRSLCSFSKYSNKEIVLNSKDYETKLSEFLIKYSIELIIIVGTNSFKIILPMKQDLKGIGVNMVTVDIDKLNMAFSKIDTYAYAKKIGIPIPKTYYPKDFSELNELKSQLTYPCVIKGLYEVGGNIVDYVYRDDDLEKKYFKVCKDFNLTTANGLPMLQEYIAGYGCAFFAVYNKGECGLTFQHKRIREYPVSGGASVCAESYKNNLVQEYGKKLLDSLEWHGVAMVEFKLNNKGIPILMEINPKFWGSCDIALEAGVNFPKAIVDIHSGKDVEYSMLYKYPFRYHWPLNDDIFHGIRNPKKIFEITKDLLSSNVKSNIWLSDFYPNMKLFFDFLKKPLVEIYRKAIN